MAATLDSEAPLDADMAYRALNTLSFAVSIRGGSLRQLLCAQLSSIARIRRGWAQVHKTAPAALQKVQFGDVLSTGGDAQERTVCPS